MKIAADATTLDELTNTSAWRSESFRIAQQAHEMRLADYLAHQIRDALGDADLAELIAVAEALGIDPTLPRGWRTKREKEIAALEEEAAENLRRAAELRGYR